MGTEKEHMEEIYRQYARTVYKYLCGLTMDRDTAEELTAETFYQAMKSIKSYNGSCKLSVWLCQIGKHLWYQELSKRNKYKKVSEEQVGELTDSASEPYREVVASQNKVALYKHLRHLDEDTREVMYLRLTGELSYREIGEIMEKTENWARVTFYRGKQKMKKGWDKYE